MQQIGEDLPYGTVPGDQLSEDKTFFSGLPLYLAERCCENLQSARVLTHCQFGPVNNMVDKRNHLLYHFSTKIHLHPQAKPGGPGGHPHPQLKCHQ